MSKRLSISRSGIIKRVLELLREITEIEHRVNMLYMKVEKRRVLLEQLLDVLSERAREKED